MLSYKKVSGHPITLIFLEFSLLFKIPCIIKNAYNKKAGVIGAC